MQLVGEFEQTQQMILTLQLVFAAVMRLALLLSGLIMMSPLIPVAGLVLLV